MLNALSYFPTLFITFYIVVQHSEEEVNIHPLHVIKVPYAAKWTARMNDGFGIGMGIGKSSPATTDSCSVDTVPATKLESDWTFSSDYVCSLVNESPSTDGGSYEGVVLRARELPTPAAAATATTKDQATGMPCVRSSSSKDQSGSWRIECAVESGVDYSMLRRQDEPILFYDEFLLYQVGIVSMLCYVVFVVKMNTTLSIV